MNPTRRTIDCDTRTNRFRRTPAVAAWMLPVLVIVGSLVSGCHEDMYDQKKYRPLSESEFYRDGQSSRPLVEGSVVHRDHADDGLVATGMVNGQPSTAFPFPVSEATIRRGQERFNIYCSPCHGRTGDGQGMIVQRGFPQPPSFHADSIRTLAVGRYVDVIAHGFGRMYSYADRVEPRDRWAIAAYIRALQASREVPLNLLTASQQRQMK